MEERPDIQFIEKEKCTFDFAYAITCHKSQGSEFESILVNNENFGKTYDERIRWTYTAITRARKMCYLVEPNE
jgi:exodeoxyribonuclease-5